MAEAAQPPSINCLGSSCRTTAAGNDRGHIIIGAGREVDHQCIADAEVLNAVSHAGRKNDKHPADIAAINLIDLNRRRTVVAPVIQHSVT